MRKLIILDTSILCVFLEIPGKDTCSNGNSEWNKKKVDAYLTDEEAKGATLVLPIATIIETGNHIAQAPEKRYENDSKLCALIEKAVDEKTLWAAFTAQNVLWNEENLKRLAHEWPNLAVGKLSMGDATIKNVAEYYAQQGYHVEIFTGDSGLRSYEPLTPPSIPRRRKSNDKDLHRIGC